VTTFRLLSACLVSLFVLALGRGGLPGVFPALCFVALLVIGELWLRALTDEAVAPVARVGIVITGGLLSLPFVAIALHAVRVPIRAHPLALGLAVLAGVLGLVALGRERFEPPAADPRLAGTLAPLAIPGGLALVVGAAAVYAYAHLPQPPQPGYTSLALNGWAAGIDRPVDIPARGLRVPIQVSSTGEPSAIAPLRVEVGGVPAGAPRPVTITADSTSSVEVHVPAPPDGCLHRIEISLGAASTIFYGRGPRHAQHRLPAGHRPLAGRGRPAC
jgi:hypothetical protein